MFRRSFHGGGQFTQGNSVRGRLHIAFLPPHFRLDLGRQIFPNVAIRGFDKALRRRTDGRKAGGKRLLRGLLLRFRVKLPGVFQGVYIGLIGVNADAIL